MANKRRWQRALSIWLAACLLSAPFAFVQPANAQQQLKGTITKMGGLNTAVFETPHGKLKVNLPDDAAAGDTISGTVVAEPAGNTPEEKAQNEDELNGYVIAVQPKQPPGKPPVKSPKCEPGKPITCNLPPGCSGINVSCNPPGSAAQNSGTSCSVPCDEEPPAASPLGACTMPTVGQCGKPFEVKANCDGKFDNSACSVGGQACKMLAESPRKMIAESPKNLVGPSKLKVQEGSQIAEGPFCNVKIKLVCPKPVLHQGETSTLTCTVLGLANVKGATLSIDNNSPEVLSLSGGDHQVLPLATQAMYYKSGGMEDCPDDKGTPTPPITSSPTAVPMPPGYAPPVVPPEGSQTTTDGTNTSVYPGGMTIVTPGGGGIPTIIPPGLGEAPPGSPDPGKGSVIARQVEPNGTVVKVYSNGFVSRTPPGGTPQWDKDPIF